MTVVLSEKATAKIPLVSLVQYTLSSSSARLVAGRPAGGGGGGGRGGGRRGSGGGSLIPATQKMYVHMFHILYQLAIITI